MYDSYDRMTSVIQLLVTVNHSAGMAAAMRQSHALTSGFIRRLWQSSALHSLLLRTYDQQPDLSASQVRALDHVIAKMQEQGIGLARASQGSIVPRKGAETESKLARFNRLSDEEIELKSQFLSNVAHSTAAFQLSLRNGKHLRGVPHSTLAHMARSAAQRNLTYSAGSFSATHPASSPPPLDGAAPTPEWGPWTITFDSWVYNSMMAHCPTRRLRQVLFQSYENRASRAPWDNAPVVERLLQVRRSKALLLNAPSYADLVGRGQMASPVRAKMLLDDLLAPVASAALRTVLRVVRLMVDSQAEGKDVWGDRIESNIEFYGGTQLALGRNSEVSIEEEEKPKFAPAYLGRYSRPWPFSLAGAKMSASPKVNMEALEEAERIMSNSTLSQSDCVALLNNVTTKFRLWDASFWAHRLDASQNSTEQNPGGEPEDFRNYFTLSRVLSGAFALLNRLWGMHVVESVHDKPQVWHPDVRHYRLFNDSQLLGSFFFDPYARPNKSSASRTYSLVKRSEVHDHWPNKVRYPVAVMVTSIVPPESGKPALLDIMDVQNLFHELGHVIQHLVNQESQALIAGTTTLPLDLFEMFATFYELWATEDSILRMMAQDYKTHALLTADKQKRLMQAVRRTRPLLTLEQLYFAKMDLSLHLDYKANATETIFTHRQKVANDTLLIPYSTNNCDFCSLVHTFGHQYASTYYSYLWSETHASDAMGYFEEMGISNDTQVRALGNKMAAVLLNDGMSSTDAESQYVKFRGRPVSKEHFVKHLVF